MSWHARLKDQMERKGFSAVTLARRAGVPQESVYKYLQGRTHNPRGNVVKKLADALEVSELWIMHGDVVPHQKRLAVSSLQLISLIGWNGGLKEMDSLKELARETIPIPSDAAVGANAFAVRIDDGAIDRLPVGSIVVVDPERPPEPSRYVLAWSNVLKRAVVRRWRATDYSGAGQLIADNPDYPPLQMSVAEDGYIVGRVVMLIAEL